MFAEKQKHSRFFWGGVPTAWKQKQKTPAHVHTAKRARSSPKSPRALRFNYALTGKQDRKQRERLPSRSRLLPPHMRPNVPKCERASPCDAGALHQSQILDTTSPSNRTRGGERHPLLGAAAIYQSVLRLCLF